MDTKQAPSNARPHRVSDDTAREGWSETHLIATAVRAALEQSWWNCRVTVIDDAGSDATEEALRPFFDRRNFIYIRLARNLGTANAKNAGLLLTGGAAVTFRDSDDIPHRDKLNHQVRVISAGAIGADQASQYAHQWMKQ